MYSLNQVELFNSLTDTEIESLTKGSRLITRRKGEHIFYQDEELPHYYFVESGCVRLYRVGYDGQEKVFQQIEEGMIFAESIAFAAQRMAPLTAMVMKKSRILELDSNKLLDLLNKNAKFAGKLTASMAQSLYLAVSRIDQLTVNKATQRLVLYLADLHHIQKGHWIKLPYSQSILSRQLNIEPETLSRILTRFKENGCLSLKGRECVILNPEHLCEIVNLPSDTFTRHSAGPVSDSLFRCCGS